MIVASLGAILGDSVGYAFGKRVGPQFFARRRVVVHAASARPRAPLLCAPWRENHRSGTFSTSSGPLRPCSLARRHALRTFVVYNISAVSSGLSACLPSAIGLATAFRTLTTISCRSSRCWPVGAVPTLVRLLRSSVKHRHTRE